MKLHRISLRIFKSLAFIGKGIIGLFLLIMAIIFIRHKIIEYYDKKIITKDQFQSLHNQIVNLDSLRNIAFLPNSSYFVINGIVVNKVKRTFGNEPELGFYMQYYTNGQKNKFGLLDEILKSSGVDSLTVEDIFNKMKHFGIADITKEVNPLFISYRKKVSAMWGERGIIYSSIVLAPSESEEKIEWIKDNFYYFERN
jgi:hypothetical protein